MNSNLLELYLKLNFLLAVAFLLWMLTKRLARLLCFEVSHAQQLKVARMMFAGLLLVVPVMVLVKMLMPAWIKGMVAAASSTGIVQEFTFTANVNDALGKSYQFGNFSFDTTSMMLVLLLVGFSLLLARLTVQISRLRRIITDATEWKSIHGIQLLISSSITSPFSTCALGSKQIVLPMQLLESPRNLRLAIKHELQHARSGDLQWVILLEVTKVLCFWNPAAWLWHNEFDCLQEFACDEVLVNERRVNSQAYGNCLLDVASVVTGRAVLASSNMVPKFSFLQNHKNQLKRRILMLKKISNKKNAGLKTLCYTLLIGFGLAETAAMVFAAETSKAEAQVKPASDDVRPIKRGAQFAAETSKAEAQVKPASDDVRPIKRGANPDYPWAALTRGLEGWVVLDFTIDEKGGVQNAIAKESCGKGHSEPDSACKEGDIFKEPALTSLKTWTYAPQMKNGIAEKRDHVQTMMKFQIESDNDVKSVQQK